MPILDVDLVGIVGIRIFEAFLVFVALETGRWIRTEASGAGWPVAVCRLITATAWVIALGSVGGFVTSNLWLESGALLTVLVTFLTSGLITAAIAEHPVARGMVSKPDSGHPTPVGATKSDTASVIQEADRWRAVAAGVVLGGSAFFGRSLLLGADVVLVGWLASRRPIPVIWISLVGVAAGLVGGGLVTADPAPVTIALLAIGVLCSALILRRLASGAAAMPAL